MSAKTDSRLTPRQRLSRGLSYSAQGPVDVTRGVVGLSVQSAQSTASGLRRRYREGRLAREIGAAQETLAQELAAAQEVVVSPEAGANVKDLDSFKAAFGNIGKNGCGGCHQDYRLKKS